MIARGRCRWSSCSTPCRPRRSWRLRFHPCRAWLRRRRRLPSPKESGGRGAPGCELSAAWADSRVVPPCQSTQTCTVSFFLFHQLAIGVPDRRLNVRIFHRGHSFAVQGVDHAENSVAPLLRGWRRNEHTTASMAASFRTPVGTPCASRSMVPAGGLLDCGGNVRQPQRFVVGDSIVACGVHEPDGIVGRDLVQVGSNDVAALRQLAFIPAAPVSHSPGFSLTAAACTRRFTSSTVGGIAQAHGVELVDSSFSDMGVAVDESGGCSSAMQIDDTCLRSGELQDFFVRTYGDDFSLANSNRLGYGVLGVYGQDFSVDQDQVRRLSRCRNARQEASEGYRFEHESEITVTNLRWRRNLSPNAFYVSTNPGCPISPSRPA